MNLEQFKSWAISQGVVSTPIGTYPSECVSLVQNYINKVYGIPFTPRGHAKDWATNGNVLSYFDKVSSPQAGDIGISGATATNPYGHIWIYTSPTTILEQNGRVSRRVSTGNAYTNPIAILRRKGTSGGQDMVIQGENEFARANQLHVQLLGRPLSRETFNQLVGKSWLNVIEIFSDHKETQQQQQVLQVGRVAVADKWQQQIYDLQAQVKSQQTALDEMGKQIRELQAQLGVQSDDTKLLNGFGEWLQKIIIRLGVKK